MCDEQAPNPIDCSIQQIYFSTWADDPHLHTLWLVLDGHFSDHTYISGPDMDERIANG